VDHDSPSGFLWTELLTIHAPARPAATPYHQNQELKTENQKPISLEPETEKQ
jgi:hypothetical protein